ncbi:DUF6157 family protein [Luteococcus sp. OSA5]|uniref:DUF6157 family protein n=1 Tax=Luteococcus sp. OSA5 TaxID=3401630 RepID=UPI003B42802F
MSSTNYTNTFIAVAEDCPATTGEIPKVTAKGPTIASLQYQLLADHPYELTSDDLLFAVHTRRQAIPQEQWAQARKDFFAKAQACLRSSPLGKRYGWGLHHDAEGRVALVAVGSARYEELVADAHLTQTRAMRSRRA